MGIKAAQTTDLSVIDLHAHWGRIGFPTGLIQSKQLYGLMDRNGIERCVISMLEAISYDFKEGNAALFDLIRSDQEGRLLGYLFLNPNYLEESLEMMDHYLDEDESIVGLKLYADGYIAQPLDCRGHVAFIERLAKHYPGKIVLFHCGQSNPQNPARLRRLALEFPSVRFIAGHMGAGLWRQALDILQDCENVYMEISAPAPERGRLEDAVDAVGAERVVFGSDLPLINPAYMLGCVYDAEISEGAKEAILRDNAIKLLGLIESTR